MLFSWDAANISHIARHGVMPDEEVFVVRHAAPPFPRTTWGGRFVVWGPTRDGRLLQVVFVEVTDDDIDPMTTSLMDLMEGEKVVRIFHARDLEDDEKKGFRRLRSAL